MGISVFLAGQPAGTGLDQCTVPTTSSASGSGDLSIPTLEIKGSGIFKAPCEATVEVSPFVEGDNADERQSIILPGPIAGTWDLSLNFQSQFQEVTLDFDADASEIEVALEAFSNIGTNNVTVSGSGTSVNPFVVDFINDLAATSVPLLAGDGSDLLTAATGSVVTIVDGTANERQTITKADGVTANLTITYNAVSSVPLAHNSSLDDVQDALEAMSSIGAGNISVTGPNPDRTAAHNGPWNIDFLGVFAGQNVAKLQVTSGYTVTTDWEGGSGINEQQKISLRAGSGTFRVTVFNADSSQNATTIQLPHNASASLVESNIVSAASFIDAADIIVEDVGTPAEGNTNEFLVTFQGQHASTNMPTMTLDISTMFGPSELITITEEVTGFGINERQLITITDANSGTYTLTLLLKNVTATTNNIQFDANADSVESALGSLSNVDPGDLTVTESNGVYTVIFDKTFGNVALMGANGANLVCNPSHLPIVFPGPYAYDLVPDRPDELTPASVSTGSLSAEANISTQIRLERDLFDPNRKSGSSLLTVRDIALLKKLDVALHTPYRRSNGTLVAASYSQQIATGDSFVLVETSIDDEGTRNRILSHIATHREILPMRITL